MERLAVLGASGHGKVVAEIAEKSGWREIVFFDDAWPESTRNLCCHVAGNSQSLIEKLDEFSGVIVAIGDNAIRAQKLKWLLELGAPLVSLLHPSSVVSQSADLDVGVVVMPGVVINASVRIGCGVILNTACSVDHDCVISDCVHISPGVHLAGGVKVGLKSWIGIGATVIELVNIGQNVIVGAGGVVVGNIPDNLTVMGVPAKPA